MLIVSGPDGYDTPWWSLGQRLLAGTRRLPTAPWFALCGAIPASGASPFLIGASARLRLPAGRLLCFANDVPGFNSPRSFRSVVGRCSASSACEWAEAGTRRSLGEFSGHCRLGRGGKAGALK
jgi:hypothetical protein